MWRARRRQPPTATAGAIQLGRTPVPAGALQTAWASAPAPAARGAGTRRTVPWRPPARHTAILVTAPVALHRKQTCCQALLLLNSVGWKALKAAVIVFGVPSRRRRRSYAHGGDANLLGRRCSPCERQRAINLQGRGADSHEQSGTGQGCARTVVMPISLASAAAHASATAPPTSVQCSRVWAPARVLLGLKCPALRSSGCRGCLPASTTSPRPLSSLQERLADCFGNPAALSNSMKQGR